MEKVDKVSIVHININSILQIYQ
uniref:Uncharacterized protein n=1 Tax=Rhizophora mucronata TaxID=61149 RepID=A0A2P2NDN6_RHIMU